MSESENNPFALLRYQAGDIAFYVALMLLLSVMQVESGFFVPMQETHNS